MVNSFTLQVHHGGSMVFDTDGTRYVGGGISPQEFTDLDKMSIFELNGILNDLGYSSAPTYCLKSGTSNWMNFVENDECLIEDMAEILKTQWEEETIKTGAKP
ncbi:MAG: hypothetical protein EOP45_19565 [Sphingobacteriaceae bacterium]|nr:MAG: hypothetical protein EOP45_19565 [Sphingobacteriaceae bacterium]